MSKSRYVRLVELWKAELKAAELTVDHIAELTHRALARRYARLAGIAHRRMMTA
ncbi:hypothetical protein [Sphingobium sp. SCG-1]|uniref:hypothetical protein n=1 Tax=Sphingobium sp. SCG-1 TaxID=2072936 RepID=UPI00166FDE38|nr:hypothetical protein [Sphingobium sp. SCG-1]